MPYLLRASEERGLKIIPVRARTCVTNQRPFRYPDPQTGDKLMTLDELQFANDDMPLKKMMDDRRSDELLTDLVLKISQCISDDDQ